MKYLAFIITAAITLTACNRFNNLGYHELDCPPYDPTILHTWFPYQEGDTFYYKDDAGDTQWLGINSVVYYDGDEPAICDMPTECIPGGSVFASREREQEDKIWLYANHSAYNNSRGDYMVLAFNSINIEMVVNDDGTLSLAPLYDERPEQYYKDIKPIFSYHATRALDEVTYSDVYEIELPENDMGNAKTIYLVKQHGIVGYTTQTGNTYWLQR